MDDEYALLEDEYIDTLVDFEPDVVRALVAEIRRYRAMLLDLWLNLAMGDEQCWCCDGPKLHAEGCIQPAIEAEVRAILADQAERGAVQE